MRSRHNSVTLYSLLFLCLISWLLTFSGPAQDKQATGSGPVPITLNGESTGDVSDTTPLMTKLRRLFKERETNGVFRPKSNEIEKAVFLDAARDTSIIDFARIFAAANAAGATPIQIPVEKPPRVDIKPNPLMLLAFAGKPEEAAPFPHQDGIEISFIGELEQGGSIGSGRVLIDVDKNGNYSIGGKPVSSRNLLSRLRPLKPADRTIFVDARNTADIGPLKDVASAAANAGCKKLYFITRNIASSHGDLSFSISPAWYKTDGPNESNELVTNLNGPDDAVISFVTAYLTDDFLQKASRPGSAMSRGSASLTAKDLSDELDLDYADALKRKNGTASRLEIDGVPGVLIQYDTVTSENGSVTWHGYRMKGGKLQLIRIEAYCSKTEYAHRKAEFAAVLHSVKIQS